MMLHRRYIAFVLVVLVVIALAGAAVWRSVVPGLSSARGDPPAIEVSVATLLLRASVPAEDKARTNPLGGDPADIAAGQDIFRQKCEVCHGYDGSGKTDIGAGEYPRPPALRSMNIMALTDGEIFYHIRNGIRNTGMPAWSMPDGQVWQLVAYLRHLPKVASLSPDPVAETKFPTPRPTMLAPRPAGRATRPSTIGGARR
jgi:mono/diheme cytochrome c family protein